MIVGGGKVEEETIKHKDDRSLKLQGREKTPSASP